MSVLKKVFLGALFCLFVTQAHGAVPTAVTLFTPTNATYSSLVLSWPQTATADADFTCYKVMRSTYSGAQYYFPVPALGGWGLAAMALFLALAAFRRLRGVAVLGFLLALAPLVWSASYPLPWVSDCVSPKSTAAFTDTGLNSAATYYYKVLVFGPEGHVESNEVSASTLSRWTASGVMLNPSNPLFKDSEAYLLSDGKVLTHSLGSEYGRLQVYDPNTGQWSSTSAISQGFLGYSLYRIPGTDKFLADYSKDGLTFFQEMLIYDYAKDSWSSTESYKNKNALYWAYNATVSLPDGRIMVAGGMPQGGGKYFDTVEIYDPNTGTWSFTGSMNRGRTEFTTQVLKDGRVLVAGSNLQDAQNPNPAGAHFSAEIYDPATGKWTLTGSMNEHRSFFPLVKMADGKVMAIGGRYQKMERKKYGGIFSLLITEAIRMLAVVDIYDPSTGVWSAAEPLATPRQNHFGILLNNGRILAGGGHNNKDTYYKSTEIYNPN